MLLIVALPAALLAGQATEALFRGAAPGPGRRVLAKLTVAAAILAGGFVLRLVLHGEVPRWHVYWVSLLVTLPAAFWVLGARDSVLGTRAGQLLWCLLLFLDLWALARPLAMVRPEADVYRPSECVARLGPGRRILDRDAPGPGTGTPLGAALRWRCSPAWSRCAATTRSTTSATRNTCNSSPAPTSHCAARRPAHLPGHRQFPYQEQAAARPPRDRLRLAADGPRRRLAPGRTRLARLGEDAAPAGYDFASGGRRPLPAYTVYENTQAFPRAFVVPEAAPLPERPMVLDALAATDFRERVLLEQWDGSPRPGGAAADYRPAEVLEYRPNRVRIGVGPGAAGYLVLADVWYPGWTCTVDGRPAPLYRADYLFRAVELPEGAREVVFTFAPASYRLGRLVSGAALAAALALLLAGAVRKKPLAG